MSRFIKLTRVITELNEKGKEKVTDAVKSQITLSTPKEVSLRDEHGRSVEDYENMGVPVPEELLSSRGNNSEIEVEFEDSDVKLDKEDWEEFLSPTLVNIEFVETFEQTEHYVLVGYQSGEEIYIKESIEEIEKLIK